MDFAHSLRLIAPEETLSVAALILLLVSAWSGDKAARLISILSVAVLVGCMFLVAPALCSGAAGPDVTAFGGQYRADAFASFAKLLIYGAAAASLMVTPAFFGGAALSFASPSGLARARRASSAAMSCRIGARKLSG